MDIPGYDAWRTRAPGDGPYDPPPFKCEDCEDEGCPACSEITDDEPPEPDGECFRGSEAAAY